MKSSMTSIRVIYVHREREKVDFKSREVNCLKECALDLRQTKRRVQYLLSSRCEGPCVCVDVVVDIIAIYL